MNNAEIKFKFITPCITAGADKLKAELRATAIRGQLRWWYRAFNLEGESDIFGGVNGNATGSSLMVRILSETIRTEVNDGPGISGNPYDYFLWPLRGSRNDPNSGKRGFIPPEQKAEIQLLHRRNGTNSALPENVLKAFLLLGSLGSRSRRCYGSIWPEQIIIDGMKWAVPGSESAFIAALNDILDTNAQCRIIKISSVKNDWKSAVLECADFLKAFRCGSPKSGTPSKWGQNDHDVIRGVKKVYRQAIGLPLSQRYSNNAGTIESQIDGFERLASPVHFKVIPLDNGFMPIATVFPYHSPEDDTEVMLKGRGTSDRRAVLDNDLLLTIATPGSRDHREVWTASKLLADFIE